MQDHDLRFKKLSFRLIRFLNPSGKSVVKRFDSAGKPLLFPKASVTAVTLRTE